MLYMAMTSDDMKNGDGLRVVLWTAGCSHRCKQCHNPQTWDVEHGNPFTEKDEEKLFDFLMQSHISGITFSGGDPLYPDNREEVGRLAKKAASIPGKDVWMYTGYTLSYNKETDAFEFSDDVMKLPKFSVDWIDSVSVIVDGRYDCDVRMSDLKYRHDPYWRGSSNQRLIDVKKSLKEKRIVELTGWD